MPQKPPEQELRLAVVMTGGVSLAIWMGGVASEIDQLVRARDTEHKTPEQIVYDELLELSQYRPRVDVVSGTSAGGVNGALLAGAVARRKTLKRLRSIWLEVADFQALMRSPYGKDQPSVLMGDDYFTAGLQRGIKELLGTEEVKPRPGDHPVELLVTTTLLHGEDSRLVDDFGTLVPDVRHSGIFRFDREQLMSDPLLVRRLALAARSSASFPVAFEPSWVPCSGDEDAKHPRMQGFANFHADHFVIDGGVLVNRPIEPALRSMFAMPADTEDVARAVLYVVPDPGESVAPEPEKQDSPLPLADVALRSLVTIPRTQSIAGDFERLKEHNARVTAQRDSREIVLRRLFPADIDAEMVVMLGRYRRRRAAREVSWLLGELTVRYPTLTEDLSFRPIDRQALATRLEKRRDGALPQNMPSATPTAAEIGPWGIDSLERAATVALDLAGRGYRVAGGDAKARLAEARGETHAVLETLRELRGVRRGQLRDKMPEESIETWTEVMIDLLRSDDDDLRRAGLAVAAALRKAAAAIRGFEKDGPLKEMSDTLAPDAGGQPVPEGECLRRLFALEVIQDAVGITTPVVEQPIRLLQVSANTRDGLSDKETAADKLTGMRLAHFAAFYKPSWRANDWMWGRLDAAGWLSQLVLDPSRLELVFPEDEADRRANALKRIKALALGPPEGDEHAWLAAQLEAEQDAIDAELEWLDGGVPRPAGLPMCSKAVARRVQLAILAKELPGIAEAVRCDTARDALSQTGKYFLAVWNDAGEEASPEQRQAGLRACKFANEGFKGEYDSGLLARSTSGAAATTASALAGSRSGMPALVTKSRLTASARGLGLAVHGLVDAALRRSRIAFAAIIGLTAIAGALLGAAIIADGAQPGFTSLGFTVVLAAWIVGLWRAKKRWAYVGLTVLVLAGCLVIALLPWLASQPFDPCPKVDGAEADCLEGSVNSFIDGLEPAFIVIALVVGAALFGRFAVDTDPAPIPDTDPAPPPPAQQPGPAPGQEPDPAPAQ